MGKIKVAIPVGHGGWDSGAVGYTPEGKMIRECDANLTVAKYFGDLLELNGIVSVLSRYEDVACGGATNVKDDINNQIAFVNRSEADIAVSIHFNSFNETSTGTEVLYTNYPSRDENEINLAQILLDELVRTMGLTNRGLKETPSGVGIIKNVSIPCVLSESAFISNPSENIWCSDDYHLYLIGEAHARAVCYYFGVPFTPQKYTFGLGGSILEQFKDYSDISEWSKEAITYFVENGLLKGSDTGFFLPGKAMTREEVAVFMFNVLKNKSII